MDTPAVLSDGSILSLGVGAIVEGSGAVTPTGVGEAANVAATGLPGFSFTGDQQARRLVAVLAAGGRISGESGRGVAQSAALGPTVQTPLPTSAFLFVAALGGLVLLSFRRSRDAN